MANTITLFRLPLLWGLIAMTMYGNPTLKLSSVGVCIFLIALDWIDGWVARKRGESSFLGSILDIGVDRIVELVLWGLFAYLGLIHFAIPVLVISRGILTDTVRTSQSAEGIPPFEQITTKWGRVIVSNRPMRAIYGGLKTAAFSLLLLAFAMDAGAWSGAAEVLLFAQILSWITVAICLLRGFPVLWEMRHSFHQESSETSS